MRFYYVTPSCLYYPTMAEAHKAAKTLPYFEAGVLEVEVPTDKTGVLALLNAESTELRRMDFIVIRWFELSRRGGLIEVGTNREEA